jgi:hypothetical protein
MVDEGIIELGTAAAVELAASELAARAGGETRRCANCRTSLVGPYCALCGQAVDVHRHGIWRLIHEGLENFVNFDSRIMRTFVALLFAPGELSIAFREGRTQRYVPALRLYLFVSLIFFLLLSISGIALMQFEVTAQPKVDVQKIINNAVRDGMNARDRAEVQAAIDKARREAAVQVQQGKGEEEFTSEIRFFAPIGSVQSKLSPVQRARLMSQVAPPAGAVDTEGDFNVTVSMEHAFKVLAADPAALNGPLTTWIPRVLFLLLPLYALLMALFYVRKRKKFYLVDHFVFSLNFHTFAFALLTISVFLAQVVEGEWLGWTALAILVVYGFIAMKRFYRQNWFWTSFKFVTISFIYFCFFLAPALALVLFAALSEV